MHPSPCWATSLGGKAADSAMSCSIRGAFCERLGRLSTAVDGVDQAQPTQPIIGPNQPWPVPLSRRPPVGQSRPPAGTRLSAALPNVQVGRSPLGAIQGRTVGSPPSDRARAGTLGLLCPSLSALPSDPEGPPRSAAYRFGSHLSTVHRGGSRAAWRRPRCPFLPGPPRPSRQGQVAHLPNLQVLSSPATAWVRSKLPLLTSMVTISWLA